MQSYQYIIDHEDRITWLSSSWDEFAGANNGSKAMVSAIIRQPLWNSVTGEETKYFYKLFTDKVRTTANKVSFPFRCDAPDRRRFMQMTIHPKNDGQLIFMSAIIREEPRQPLPILKNDLQRSNELLVMCAWCKAINVASGKWAELEIATRELDLFDDKPLPQISHGICPHCAEDLEKRVTSKAG
jgi:hypothetical protein